MEIKQRELKLGDVVKCFEGPWGTAIVEKVTETTVHLFRPYGRVSDIAYGDSVVCLVGVEHFSVFRDSDRTFEFLQHSDVR